MKWLLGFFTGGWGWLAAIGEWVLKNWKLVLSVLAIAGTVIWLIGFGEQRERTKWEAKWTARDVEDQLIENEHIRQVNELEDITDGIETKAEEEKARREAEYQKIEEELGEYVKRKLKEAAEQKPGSCPTRVGADGLLLIERARVARIPRAGQGNGK